MTLLELLQLMRKHLKLMIVLPIVCALATAVVCFVALPNTYTASTSMYVLSRSSLRRTPTMLRTTPTSMPAR